MTSRLQHLLQRLIPRATPPAPAAADVRDQPAAPHAVAESDLPALAGLDDIDWSSLHHAYGPAADVPRQLRALASPRRNRREAAIYDLYGNIWHQGTVWEATPHAVPFLIRLVADPATPDRANLLGLLDALANGGHREFGEPTRSAVATGFDRYVALLADPDWRVRAGSANLLGSIPDPAVTAVSWSFHRRADVESHPLVRCALWLGFGKRADSSPLTLDRLTQVLTSAPDVRERYAAASSLVRLRGKAAPDDAIHLFAMFARDEWIADAILQGLPWDWADDVNPAALAAHLDTTPEALAKSPADRAPADPIATYADPIAATADEDEAPGLAAALVFVAFPDARPLTEFPWNDRQRQAARAIVDADVLWRKPQRMAFLHGRGLGPGKGGPVRAATYRDALRRLLEQNDKR